jgi:hypothetical protein
MDVKHPPTLVKTIGRTNNNTVGVSAIPARLSNNMSHEILAL